MSRRFAGLLLPLLGLLAGQAGWSQEAPAKPVQPPALDGAFLAEFSATRGFSLGRPTQATPTPDGKAVLFLRAASAANPAQDLFEFDVATKQTKTLLTAAQLLKGGEEKLSAEEKARRERQRSQARGLASFTLFADGKKLLVPLSGKLFIVERASGTAEELPISKTPVDPKLSPDEKKLAYVLEHDLFVMDLATKEEKALTSGGTAEVSHGLAEFVAQEEMNRHSGFWWTADSQALAYEEADTRDVELWRVADPGNPAGKPREQRYPRPGKNNAKVRVGLVPAVGGATKWIRWDAEQFPYLAAVKADENAPLCLVVQNRTQQELRLLAVDPATGETRLLASEKDPAWVNIDPQMPKWLRDGSGYLWTHDEDAGTQLELRGAGQGHEAPGAILVPAAERFVDLVSVDARNERLYYIGGKDPLERHLCRCSLSMMGNATTHERLTKEPGVHRAVFSKNHAIYCLTSSGPSYLGKTTVHRADGAIVGELPSVAKEPPFLPTTEYLKVGGDQGWYCAVTRPRRFDPKLKYPVIVNVYGGPTLQTVMRSIGSQLLAQWQADQGFIVVGIDNRGTPGRGRGWERAIYKNFGKLPLEDQATALKALGAKLPELDLNHVGIKGWSFGGYMSALAVLKMPDVFHAGVAGAPVSHWEDYDTHYTERYLNLPKENAEGYKESSLLPLAEGLRRPLLLVHGTADDNVYLLHSLKLANALTRAGKDFEILPLMGMTHGISDPAMRRRVEEKAIRFFQHHLGQPTPQANVAPPTAAEGFTTLFNGKDLEGWTKEANELKNGLPRWSITPAGELKCEAGPNGFGFLRYTKEEYGDFILRLEYRFDPKSGSLFEGNSGVGIRTGKFNPAQSGATRPSYASYEIQLLDDAGRPANKLCTGSLYRYAAPSENKAKPAPEWNDLEITCEGPIIRVKLNGTEVQHLDQTQLADLTSKPKAAPAPKDKPLVGSIALQSHTGTVYFRNVQIKSLGK